MGPVITPLCAGRCRKRTPTSIRTCCRQSFALRVLRRSCSALEMNSAASRRNTKGPRHKWHAKCTCTRAQKSGVCMWKWRPEGTRMESGNKWSIKSSYPIALRNSFYSVIDLWNTHAWRVCRERGPEGRCQVSSVFWHPTVEPLFICSQQLLPNRPKRHLLQPE